MYSHPGCTFKNYANHVILLASNLIRATVIVDAGCVLLVCSEHFVEDEF